MMYYPSKHWWINFSFSSVIQKMTCNATFCVQFPRKVSYKIVNQVLFLTTVFQRSLTTLLCNSNVIPPIDLT